MLILTLNVWEDPEWWERGMHEALDVSYEPPTRTTTHKGGRFGLTRLDYILKIL